MILSNILSIKLVTISILKEVLTSQSNFHKTFVRTDSILRKYEVRSISQCYFECWDVEFQCCAVGFLSSEINNKKKHNATCHMIKCNQQVIGGGVVELEILKTPKLSSEEPVKLPKNGVASQSSTHGSHIASLAVDGNYSPQIAVCTHTLERADNYWEYNLPYTFALESIEIYSRSDCCTWRLSNAAVLVKTESGFSNCVNTGNMNRIYIKRIYCEKPLKGSGIRVQSLNSEAITICEINIYGKKLSL